MKQKTKIIRPGFRVISSDIDGFDSLADFALDLRCSWNHEADEIWYQLDPDLSESLPIYSGGLGNVAGDQLKAASDLGVPIVGVGLLYQQCSKLKDGVNGYQNKISVPATLPEADYTLRVIPNLPGVLIPLETVLIHWQR